VRSDSIDSNGQTSSRDSDYMLISALSVDPQPCPEPDIVVLDPIVASPSHELAKKRKKGYELNRHFQDSWAAKLPWAKAIVGVDGRITQVHYKVYSDERGERSFWFPKLTPCGSTQGGRRLWWTWPR
jgi:hypothetical protein